MPVSARPPGGGPARLPYGWARLSCSPSPTCAVDRVGRPTWCVRIVLAIAFAAATATTLTAQGTNRVELEAALSSDANRDLLASPFVYHGVSFPVTLTYEHAGTTNRHELWVGLGLNTLHSRYSSEQGEPGHVADQVLASFGYGYAHALGRVLGFARVYLGAAWDNVFTIRNYDYGRGLDKEAIGEVFSSVNARVVGERATGDCGALVLTADLALVALAYRNPYGISSDDLGNELLTHSYLGAFLDLASLHSVGSLLSTRTRLAYDYRVTRHVVVRATVGLRYYRFAYPRPSAAAHERVAIAAGYAF
jgi:hypothetical protein